MDMPHLSPEPSPDPAAEPVPFDRENVVVGIAGFFGAVAIAGAGAVFLLANCFTTHTHGASRSARLRWEQRRQVIQEDLDRTENARPAGESDDQPAARDGE